MNQNNVNVVGAKYLVTAVRPDQYPTDGLPEVAFIGRSNVGKSSLINSLCRHHGLARTSGTPGKTQTINFYKVTIKTGESEERREFLLVDLPGYGYARTGRVARRQWAKFIEEYFLKSPHLKKVCQLVDLRHPPMDSDLDMYKWLTEHNLPVQVIATKADKISRMQMKKHRDTIKTGIGMTDGEILVYSAVKGDGRDELLDVILEIL